MRKNLIREISSSENIGRKRYIFPKLTLCLIFFLSGLLTWQTYEKFIKSPNTSIPLAICAAYVFWVSLGIVYIASPLLLTWSLYKYYKDNEQVLNEGLEANLFAAFGLATLGIGFLILAVIDDYFQEKYRGYSIWREDI